MNGAKQQVSYDSGHEVRLRVGYLGKRAFDLIGGLVLFLVFLPVTVCVAILIRLDSPGPVLFIQERVGRNGKPFFIYKFRTMQIGTPNVAKDKLAPGQYVTRVGRYLRAWSLDELPQFLNVIAGSMSLVGHRPALASQTELNTLRMNAGVHELPPGVTGYAQVMGREDLSLGDKVRYDAYYLQHASLWFDIRLCLLTAKKAFISREGAY